MKVLVVGSGGREHAICRSFSLSNKVTELFCAPGNAGINKIAECVDISVEDLYSLKEFAIENKIDLTFVGGEISLALGITDEFEAAGLKVIGPNRAAARLEASKGFSKDFMRRNNVPTGDYEVVSSTQDALNVLVSGRFGDENSPVVVKADGLAAGKGVIVAKDRGEAISGINELSSIAGHNATSKIVLEEFLSGREVSLILFADGEDYILMPSTRDHKRIGEGDKGPNTGGMGTISDQELLSAEQLSDIEDTIIAPTLKGCINEGFRFRGILFLGLMMTTDGPKLLEYNVRFGDPETQSILIRLESDLFEICSAMIDGTLNELDIKWKRGNSACVILASKGYPQKATTGDIIFGLNDVDQMNDVFVYHAATKLDESGVLITSGGRVLGVTAIGDSKQDALDKAYAAVKKISWSGMQFRRDIGKDIKDLLSL